VWLADVDGDGHINPKEIRTVMRDVGVKLTADEIKQLIASVDADGNGMVRKHARASDLPAISWQPHAASVT
jgi:Ca2+-binding EF-hand superfamily protein